MSAELDARFERLIRKCRTARDKRKVIDKAREYGLEHLLPEEWLAKQ